jgi:hypothetical protein
MTPAVPSTPATGANLTMPMPTTTAAFISEMYFLQCDPIVENHAVVVTVEDTKDEDEHKNVLAITHSKAKATPSSPKETAALPCASKISPASPTTCIPGPSKLSDTQLAHLKTPAYTYESKAASPETTQCIYQNILNMVVPNLTILNLLAISPDL